MKIEDLMKQLRISERDLFDIARTLRFPLKRNAKKLKREWIARITAEAERRKSKPTAISKDIGKGRTVSIPPRVQVKRLSTIMGIPVTMLITELINNGIMATVNEEIDYETSAIIAEDLGFKPEEKEIDERRDEMTIGTLHAILDAEKKEDLLPRPPVITIMGHVDHGKTTLLDTIRKTSVTATEHGGITQHIGAYQTTLKEGKFKGRTMTFLDTPGHEAFIAMRERGAKITDIAVLVVAADDGVQPQTIESIKHAKNAGVPIIVAINKIDKPEANPQRVKQELADHDVLTEEWGGETVCVEISAKQNKGIGELLEMIIIVADMKNVKANPNRPAIGTVIESHLDKKRGPVATLLIQAGALHRKDNITTGTSFGTVRRMENYTEQQIDEAPPSTPVRVIGLREVPHVGDVFQVITERHFAQLKAAHERENIRREEKKRFGKVSMRRLDETIKHSKVEKLNIVLKTDVDGSLEAIMQTLATIKHEEVEIQVLRAGVGNINESDIELAKTGNAIVVGFNVQANVEAKRLAEELGIHIRLYEVIYKLIEDVKGKLAELLAPEIVEVSHGKMKIIAIFKRGHGEMIVGGKVIEGEIRNKTFARVVREKNELGVGKITQLQHEKKAKNEVREGFEAGISFMGDVAIEEGDLVESFSKSEVKRNIE